MAVPRRVSRRVRSAVPSPFAGAPVYTDRTSDVLFGGVGGGVKTRPSNVPFEKSIERVKDNFGGQDVESEELATRYGDETFKYDPTATIDPPRPRTLRAGWVRPKGSDTGVIIVQFREGAVYEYSEVPYSVWRNFRRVKSPGRLVNRTLNGYPYRRVSG